MLHSLLIYLKMYIRYSILRKTEFFIRTLNKWLQEKTIKKYIYHLIGIWSVIQLLITTVLIIAIWNYLQHQISNESLALIFILIILSISIFDGFFLTERVLTPFDEKILAVSPFNNREMFLFTFLSEFLIKKSFYYCSLIVISLILVTTNPDLSWPFFFSILGTIILASFLTLKSTVIKCLIQVRRVKKGYKIEPFFYIFFIGTFICFITIVISQVIFKWVQGVHGFWVINNWGKLVLLLVEQIDYYLQLKIQIPTIDIYLMKLAMANFTFEDIIPLLLWFFILLILTVFCFYLAGKWYRHTWQFDSYFQNDWFNTLEKVLLSFTKDIIKKVQIKQLFRNRDQLSHHFAQFYGHYFNYFYIGVAIAATILPVEKDSYLRFFIVFFLFYRIAADAFDSVSLYPDLLRFDGDGKRLYLYRAANRNLLDVYKAKIYVQRTLGFMECLFFFIILGIILALTRIEIVFVSTIFFVHILCLPHLLTLSSYISPHISRQHYSEADEHIESHVMQGILSGNVTQIAIFMIFIPIFYMLFIEANIQWFFSVTIVLMLIIYGTIYCFIYMLLYKLTPVVNKIDLK